MIYARIGRTSRRTPLYGRFWLVIQRLQGSSRILSMLVASSYAAETSQRIATTPTVLDHSFALL
jgi:hypothetical protein